VYYPADEVYPDSALKERHRDRGAEHIEKGCKEPLITKFIPILGKASGLLFANSYGNDKFRCKWKKRCHIKKKTIKPNGVISSEVSKTEVKAAINAKNQKVNNNAEIS